MDSFRSIDEIPLPYRNVFIEYPCFNAVQSQVLDDILHTDNSVVVSAPTGSGKTAIFELAIIRLLIQYENIDVSQTIKIVYICPIKALCHERLSDWHKKFSPFGLNCVAVTGDSDNFEFQQLKNHNLIISTPEKWDSLTRRWKDNEKIVRVVKLFMIDEVHLLNEENRGSTLEVIVCRMKTVENSMAYSEDENVILNQKVRFIALSATVPNVEDIALWLGNRSHTKHYKFSDEMRPVPLKKLVYGYNYNSKATSPFKFDISLNYKLPTLMMEYSEEKPTLIFCSTRKSVEMTANHLVQSLQIHLNEEQRQKLVEVANMITDAKAKATVKHGVAYHHAGMIPETRHAIENLFRNGDLPVLVTTSTLSMGVNLPAHLVIIKSTKCYDAGGFRDYTEIAIHQMIGRAGRPQFDTSATAIILTTNEDKPKFEKMVSCGQPIESNLHRHLTEHLNAEVVLGTITDLVVAMQWLSSTFLYVRARKNPRHYGISMGYTEEQIDKKLLEMCQIDLNKLVSTGMITMDQNIVITANVTGKIMAKYYVAFETMKLFTQISGTEILMQILALISKCQEFALLRLRVNDKKTLNLLNKNSKKDTIRFPLNGKIKTFDMKVNCIIQAVLGNLDILDHSILNESFTIMRNGARIAKCLIEYLETKGSNCYSALLNATILAKCFRAKLWETSPFVSKQLTGIGNVMSNQLARAGKTTFKKILDSNPRELEMIIKRKSPMGNALVEEVEHIPRYNMTVETVANGKQLRVCVALENADDLKGKSTVNKHSMMVLLVGDNSNEILMYEKYDHSYMIQLAAIEKIVDINPKSEEVFAHFISEDWVGFDCNSKVQMQTNQFQKIIKVKTAVKNPSEKRPAFVQMFLDMYMKPKKKIPAEKKTPAKQPAVANKRVEEKNWKVIKKCDSTTDGELEGLKTDNFINMSDQVPETENPQTEKDFSLSQNSLFSDKQDNGNEKIVSTHVVGDEDVQKNDFAKGLINIKERVAKTSSLFFLSQKYERESQNGDTSNQFTNKRKSEDVDTDSNFEDSLYREDARKRQTLEEFKFPTKKKLSHNPETMVQPDSTVDNKFYTITEILEPYEKKNDPKSENEYFIDSPKARTKENYQKSITWRSPLVFSPAEKFSPPRFRENFRQTEVFPEKYIQNQSIETFETSPSSRSNINLNINIQKTPKTNAAPSHANKFALRDKDYVSPSKEQQLEEPLDICSPSFLEMFGKSSNQYKSTPKVKTAMASPVVNYYSQLLFHPVQSQKYKPQESSQLHEGNLESKNVGTCNESVIEERHQTQGYREDVPKSSQDVRDFKQEACVPNPSLYSEDRYVPQATSNGGFTPKPRRERCPYSHTQDYRRGKTLNFSYGERFHDLPYNSSTANQEFLQNNYALAGPSYLPYNYYNYPQTPRRNQFGRNFYGGMYEQAENVPSYSNRHFEKSLPYEAVDLNQSQLLSNLNCGDFNEKIEYSQHFANGGRRDDCQVPSMGKSETDYRIFDHSPTERESVQNFNQENIVQRKPLSKGQVNFERSENRYNSFRNPQRPFVLKEEPRTYAPSYYEDKDNSFQRCPVRNYDREGVANPIAHSLNYTQSLSQVPQNEFFGNRSVENFSFEDKPNLVPGNVDVRRFREPKTVYRQRNEVEPLFHPRFSQEQDFGCQGQFGRRQIQNFDRSFAAYAEPEYFPSGYREMNMFPPSNDKEYVMNKFLYSLNQR